MRAAKLPTTDARLDATTLQSDLPVRTDLLAVCCDNPPACIRTTGVDAYHR